jgi:hypothetical protein
VAALSMQIQATIQKVCFCYILNIEWYTHGCL